MSASPWQLVNSPERLRGNRRHLGDRRPGSIAFTESPSPGLVRDVPARLLSLSSKVSRTEDDLVSQFWSNFEAIVKNFAEPSTTLCHSFERQVLVRDLWDVSSKPVDGRGCSLGHGAQSGGDHRAHQVGQQYSLQLDNNILCNRSLGQVQQYSFHLIRLDNNILCTWSDWTFNNIPCNWSLDNIDLWKSLSDTQE